MILYISFIVINLVHWNLNLTNSRALIYLLYVNRMCVSVCMLVIQAGPVLLTILGIMAIHSMILLVHSCQTLCKR